MASFQLEIERAFDTDLRIEYESIEAINA